MPWNRTLRIGYLKQLLGCDLTNIRNCRNIDYDRLRPFLLLTKILEIPWDKLDFIDIAFKNLNIEEVLISKQIDMLLHLNWAITDPRVTLILPLFQRPLVATFPPRRLVPRVSDHEYIYSPFSITVWIIFVFLGIWRHVGSSSKVLRIISWTAAFLQILYASILKGNRTSFVLEDIPFRTVSEMRHAMQERNYKVLFENTHNYAFRLTRRAILDKNAGFVVEKLQGGIEGSYEKSVDFLSRNHDWFMVRSQGYARKCGFPEIEIEGIQQRSFGFILSKTSPLIRKISSKMPVLARIDLIEKERAEKWNVLKCKKKYNPKMTAERPVIERISFVLISDLVYFWLLPGWLVSGICAGWELMFVIHSSIVR